MCVCVRARDVWVKANKPSSELIAGNANEIVATIIASFLHVQHSHCKCQPHLLDRLRRRRGRFTCVRSMSSISAAIIAAFRRQQILSSLSLISSIFCCRSRKTKNRAASAHQQWEWPQQCSFGSTENDNERGIEKRSGKTTSERLVKVDTLIKMFYISFS